MLAAAAALGRRRRRQFHRLLSSSGLRPPETEYPGDASCYDGGASAAAETDSSLASFLRLVAHARSLASSGSEALSLLRSAAAPLPPPTSELIRGAVWALRRDFGAAYLALVWGAENCEEKIGVEPWHVAIGAAGTARRFDLAWDLVNKMHKSKLLTVRAMAILMDRYAAANEARKALTTFDAMERFGLDADAAAFHSLLRALCKHELMDAAEDFLHAKKKLFPLSAAGFNIILDGWCNAVTDIREARRIWREMAKHCVVPDGTTYSLMISCYSKVGNLFNCLRLYDAMKRKGWTPDLAVYNALVYVLARENCLDDARNVFRRITAQGLQADVETYNRMIAALCEKSNPEETHKVVAEMKAKGIRPNFDTYSSLLRVADIDETFAILTRMDEAGRRPSRHTFLLLINRFLNCNESENALRVWSALKKLNISPDSSHYLALVQGLLNQGWIPKAFEYYQEMKAAGFAADPELERQLETWISSNRVNGSGSR